MTEQLKELKMQIELKTREVEKLRDTKNLAQATEAAKELTNLCDRYKSFEKLEESINQGKVHIIDGAGGGSSYTLNNRTRGVQGNEYKQNFFNAFRSKFSNEATIKLREGSLPQGGYLIPSEFDAAIQSALEDENAIRKIARIISTQSEHILPYVASRPAADWISEGQTIDLTTETFGRITLDAHKLGAVITISNELLADSYYDLTTHLSIEFTKAIARKEEEAFLTGDGNGKPTGILTTINSNSDYWKETQTTGTFNTDDLINLQYSIRRPYRKNASWLMSDETLAKIRKLKDSTQNFIWQPSFMENEPSRLLGQPVYTSPYMPAPETGKLAIFYGDFNYYVVAERGQRTIRALRELFALQDISAFLILERIDGKLIDNEAIRGLKIK